MSKYKALLAILFILESCVSVQPIGSQVNESKFSDFLNRNQKTISLDESIVKDLDFTMKIPGKIIVKTETVGPCFMHDLEFGNKQRLIVLYVPTDKYETCRQISDITHDRFIEVLKEIGISYFVKEKTLNKNKYFGLKCIKDNFFVMYLNVAKSDLPDYNYAISTFKFL
ncbi:MAG: hypothetical protein CFE23_14620 [Flavobacterium sp. BFFFF1]|uniref:hypothetical protein n=1 Tax=Flavobacterium sp. BFFFF1 TaxID=2015557 RepID=UPI000BD7EBFA|nr:hypothetical protein [Flavobacterium sp. BFFFF1]OYU79336.1 MAG: hypothetical protein CFE23_14620 [Flavobacterium sp. BFFFF1]